MEPLRVPAHLVIIGGGFGGLTVARALGKTSLKNSLKITLIDRSNHHLFQPLLYQVATAGLSPADISAPIRSVVRNQKNTEVFMAEVTGIDTEKKRVLFDGTDLSYDILVVATGSWHSYFGHDEWAKDAPGLKSVVDATAIRRKILLAFEAAEIERDPERRRSLLNFIVVGAGPTGVEMAGSIAELAHQALRSDFRRIDPQQTRIILMEAGQRILAGFPEVLSEAAKRKLETLGVEIQVGRRVQKIDSQGVMVEGGRIESRNVIWCAGVRASPAGKWLGAEMDHAGRVRVLEDLTVPGHPEIFVIGDTATLQQDGKPLPGLAPVAMQEGRYVASVILSRIEGRPTDQAFRYVNKGNLATVGRSFAIADFGRFRVSGFFAWVIWVFVHIYYLIGFRNRVLVLIEWAWAYVTFQRGARLIVEPPEG